MFCFQNRRGFTASNASSRGVVVGFATPPRSLLHSSTRWSNRDVGQEYVNRDGQLARQGRGWAVRLHLLAPHEVEPTERLCFRALAEGAVSEAKAAELLGIPIRDLNRRMEEPPPAAVAIVGTGEVRRQSLR